MRKKITRSLIAVIAVGIALTTALMTGLSYKLFEGRVLNDLRVTCALLCKRVTEQGEQALYAAADEGLRVTLIGADGDVRFDNDADARDMDNHLSRPEVRAALEHGDGQAVRRSSTLDRSLFYVAQRMQDGSVLRVAQEASSLLGLLERAGQLDLAIMAVMLLVSIVAAGHLTARLIAPIEQMTEHLSDLSGVVVYPEFKPFMDMIEKQHDEILRSAGMRVEFTANVSHELKTPLTSISGYAELIENGMAKDEQARRFAGEIHRSANRLLTLINDIIRLSQLDEPMPDMNLESVDLARVAEATMRQLALSAHKHGVTMEADTHPAVINADKQMMDELLYNLCDNAIRYNVTGGRVRIVVRPVKDKVIVCVQDTGIGISREHQEHVFERFYRVDKSRSKETGGTGLGLAIVKHIAAKHNATIDVDSEPGRGTSITVTFPR